MDCRLMGALCGAARRLNRRNISAERRPGNDGLGFVLFQPSRVFSGADRRKLARTLLEHLYEHDT